MIPTQKPPSPQTGSASQRRSFEKRFSTIMGFHVFADPWNPINFMAKRILTERDKMLMKEASKRSAMRKNGMFVPLRPPGRVAVSGYGRKQFSCGVCGTAFLTNDRPASDPKKSGTRYCSQTCYFKTLNGSQNPNFRGGSECKGCQTPLTGRQRVFCNLECWMQFRAARIKIPAVQDRINRNMRRGITYGLRKGIKGGRPWTSIVGYTSLDLMTHLEALFTEGMTWDNYGTWQIDHVKPVVLFRFDKPEDSDFKDCWSLKNLQPLWALDNQKKNANYDGENHRRG